MKKAFVFGMVLAVVGVGPALAQKTATGTGVLLSATSTGEAVPLPGDLASDPDSFIELDISGVESWDGLDDPDNTTLMELMGPGASMTGIGWDVTLETVGGSWLSEQVAYFDGQDLDGSGLFLTVGVGDGMPGIASYSSGGILDLTDNMIPDIPAGADELLYIQFYESFVDTTDGVDSFYQADSGYTIAGIGLPADDTPIVVIPTASTFGLIALFIGLAALGVYLLRR